MSVFDTSVTTSATLPTWFSDAQKNIATTGKTVYDTATPFDSTATASMSRDLFGTPSQQTYGMTPPNSGGSMITGGADTSNVAAPTGAGAGGGLPTSSNPFMTAINTLQSVASGAANPWLANGDPNKQTALGGLFAAQNARLNQILPEVTSQAGAGGIGGGNFGSLRGQTAVNTARAGALTTLAEQQNKAALDAQNYAIQAARGVGDLGSQYSTSAINTGKEEMGANLNQLAKYSDIINAMGPTMDKTTTAVTSGSQYDNLLKGLTAAGAAGAGIDKILEGKTGLGWLDKLLKTSGSIFVDENGFPVNDKTDYEP